MTEHLTPAHVQAIADEINAWNGKYRRTAILRIAHIYELGEVYEVAYENSAVHDLFIRDANGPLRPALDTPYFPPGWTQQTTMEQAESEVRP